MTHKHLNESDYDYIIIGSGFGGSVSAMRLTQKGYKVAVIEKGKRWQNKDFPKSNWSLKRYLWLPFLKFFGPQAMTLLRGVLIAHGVGVGGGSLVFAATLLRPKRHVFKMSDWPQEIDWYEELEPHYETAEKMLGMAKNPYLGANEKVFKTLAKSYNVEESFKPTNVSIYFNDKVKGPVKDPFFSGAGPDRKGCRYCGGCMVGCRHNSKNTLDKNYLYFAEKWGAEVFAETNAERLSPLDPASSGGFRYKLEVGSSTAFFGKKHQQTLRAKNVIVAAGTLGSTKFLLRNRDEYKTLPNLSKSLGSSVRTNGESLLCVTALEPAVDYSKGIAIGASFNLDEKTKIEPIRYSRGSGFISLLAVPLTGAGNRLTRPLKFLGTSFKTLPRFIKCRFKGDWASKNIIFVVMQTIEEKMSLVYKRTPLLLFRRGLTCNLSEGMQIPTYQPIAQKTAKKVSKLINGVPQNAVNEVLADIPSTAHILGGIPMGKSADDSVINASHEVHGYQGLYVCDGSVICGNLGVNPSLTITALTERFCAGIPENAEVGASELEELADRKIVFSNQNRNA